LLIAAIWASWRWGTIAWRRASLLKRQAACITYSPPADQVVYEEDRNAAAYLLRTDDECIGYPVMSDGKLIPNRKIAGRVPHAWERYQLELIAASPIWPYKSQTVPVVFLGRRISPAGHERIVCVRYFGPPGDGGPAFVEGYDCETIVITPATWRSGPVLHRSPPHMASIFSDSPRKFDGRIYAAQADPVDPSLFTIRYHVDGYDFIVDGRLDDSDEVNLSVRDVKRPTSGP
jgi:hypothetical protein